MESTFAEDVFKKSVDSISVLAKGEDILIDEEYSLDVQKYYCKVRNANKDCFRVFMCNEKEFGFLNIQHFTIWGGSL